MWREFGNNLCETVASLLIGAVPLATHALADYAYQGTAEYQLGWIADVLFVVISTAGTTVAQTAFRMVGPLRRVEVGRSPVLLLVFAVIILILAAYLYGIVVTGMARESAIAAANCLLGGAILVAVSADFVIAQRQAAAGPAPAG